MNENRRLRKPGMDRRDFLRAAALGIPLTALMHGEHAQGQTPLTTAQESRRLPGMIIREKIPENLEFPFSTLDTLVTPNDRFYVRSHFAVPTLDPATWRLRVEGAVKTTLDLTLADLMQMPARTTPATLECAGNGRVFLSPATKGAQWELGAVSNAEWTGVSLGAVLRRAGVLPGAVEVVLEGADSGEIKDPPKPSGPLHFARSLPLAQAERPEVLLAYRMNGAELPAAHGFPLRGVVPGWYGVASVKWLTRLVVTDRPFHGHFQSVDYAIWERTNGLPTRVPITEMQVKSQIARPDMRETIAAGTVYRVYGAAWTGDSDITQVEVSADGGLTWQPTKLLGKSTRFTWRFWELKWNVPTQRGRYTLLSRATDGRGRTQPLLRQPDAENYLIHHALPIDVDVL
jgi:DMSO/TMAO reductase YedYZ molybdopterin-dependent catalytic subunit